MRDPNKDHHETLHMSVMKQASGEKFLRALKILKSGHKISSVVFTVGEIVELKGCQYQIANIDRKSLRLVPVKPSEPQERRSG